MYNYDEENDNHECQKNIIMSDLNKTQVKKLIEKFNINENPNKGYLEINKYQSSSPDILEYYVDLNVFSKDGTSTNEHNLKTFNNYDEADKLYNELAKEFNIKI